MANKSYLIVGAGVFGGSTALSLIKNYPSSVVTLIDQAFPCERGASWDENKVIRTDYKDMLYARLALEAKKLWEDDPLYKKYFNKSGIVWIPNEKNVPDVDRFIQNYQELAVDVDFSVLDIEGTKKMHVGVFENANFEGVKKVFFNPAGGWARAKDALASVIQEAVNAGVRCEKAQVVAVLLEENGGKCVGIRTEDGMTISATSIILCSGAGLPKLMADSAPDRDDFQSGPRIVAAGLATGLATRDSNVSRFTGSPVCVKENNEIRGGFIPPSGDSPLKFWVDLSYKNTLLHPSGRSFSMPPNVSDYEQWEAPATALLELEAVVKGFLGPDQTDIKLDNIRLCWELVTLSEDWIVSGHPTCRGLYIATAGSFHAFKMLPILGKYVVQMLDGELDSQLAKRWAWGQGATSYLDRGLYPKRELSML